MADRSEFESFDHSQSWSLLVKGKPYTFQYENKFFTWYTGDAKQGVDTSSPSRKTSPSRKINVRHILSAVLDDNKQGFTLNFIDIKPKCLWKRGLQKFTSPDNSCESVVAFIQNVINQVKEKPRRLLVYVNPCSGKSKGVSVHKKYVEPIFQLANIESETIVTTHAGHIKEHLQSLNLSRWDGVVVVGGDGTFTEAFDALVRRKAQECGVDLLHSSDVQLSQATMPVGIVPAGTGQGMVNGATGVLDTETAVLHIIAGYTHSLDGICVHNGGKLMAIGSMLFGYGIFGDIIKFSEDNRQYGRMRYLYAMTKGMIKFRTVDVEVSYLKAQTIHTNGIQHKTDNSGTEDASAATVADDSNWIRADNLYKGVSGFLIDSSKCHPHSVGLQLADTTASRTKFVKELFKLRKSFEVIYNDIDNSGGDVSESSVSESKASKSGESSNDRTEHSLSGASSSANQQENYSAWNIPAKAIRFKLKQHSVESLAQLTRETREVMNVDGDAFTLTHPEVEVRTHADVFRMFGVGHEELRKPEWYGKK